MSGNQENNASGSQKNVQDFGEALKKAKEIIEKYNDIVITTHVNPDGDAIGSVLAMYFYLKSKGKNPVVINHSATPDNLKFLNGAEKIRVYDPKFDNEIISGAGLIIVLDVNDSKRIKGLQDAVLESDAWKMIIDHHIDPKEFADHNAVDTDASSTGEILYKLFSLDDEFQLTKEIAENLYAAIMTDSGSFRFPRTDSEVHSIIADLLEAGADPVHIYDMIYNTVPYPGFLLMGRSFASMKLYYDGVLAVMKISKNDFNETGAKEEDVENIVENSLSVKGVNIGILITEIPDRDEFRISFRSKGDYSVRDLAMKFNGGGHKNAAGARLYEGTLDDNIKKLTEAASGFFD